MSSDEPDVLLITLLPPLCIFFVTFLLIFCLCRGCCLGKCRACQATKLPPEEAQEIINSMQGDWDVTLTPGTCVCGCTSFERMTVTGSMVARIHSGSGQNRPIHLQPARASDGSLILDNFGSKAIVFTPEQGTMEIELMGWNCGGGGFGVTKLSLYRWIPLLRQGLRIKSRNFTISKNKEF